MPVDKKRYPTNWPKVSLLIRRIAGWCCEWCKIPNGVPLPSGRAGKVVLTVAHLGTPYADGRLGNKHDKHDIRRENLAALCQACHLRYDLDEHMEHAKETRQRKKQERAYASGQLSLFVELGEETPFPNVPARGVPILQLTGPGAVCRCGVQMCRCAQIKSACAKPPVERVAYLADLFSTDRLKKNTSTKQTHHNAISEQEDPLPLFMPARGSYGHGSASISGYSQDERN
jgi:hypothetical protein